MLKHTGKLPSASICVCLHEGILWCQESALPPTQATGRDYDPGKESSKNDLNFFISHFLILSPGFLHLPNITLEKCYLTVRFLGEVKLRQKTQDVSFPFIPCVAAGKKLPSQGLQLSSSLHLGGAMWLRYGQQNIGRSGPHFPVLSSTLPSSGCQHRAVLEATCWKWQSLSQTPPLMDSAELCRWTPYPHLSNKSPPWLSIGLYSIKVNHWDLEFHLLWQRGPSWPNQF